MFTTSSCIPQLATASSSPMAGTSWPRKGGAHEFCGVISCFPSGLGVLRAQLTGGPFTCRLAAEGGSINGPHTTFRRRLQLPTLCINVHVSHLPTSSFNHWAYPVSNMTTKPLPRSPTLSSSSASDSMDSQLEEACRMPVLEAVPEPLSSHAASSMICSPSGYAAALV